MTKNKKKIEIKNRIERIDEQIAVYDKQGTCISIDSLNGLLSACNISYDDVFSDDSEVYNDKYAKNKKKENFSNAELQEKRLLEYDDAYIRGLARIPGHYTQEQIAKYVPGNVTKKLFDHIFLDKNGKIKNKVKDLVREIYTIVCYLVRITRRDIPEVICIPTTKKLFLEICSFNSKQKCDNYNSAVTHAIDKMIDCRLVSVCDPFYRHDSTHEGVDVLGYYNLCKRYVENHHNLVLFMEWCREHGVDLVMTKAIKDYKKKYVNYLKDKKQKLVDEYIENNDLLSDFVTKEAFKYIDMINNIKNIDRYNINSKISGINFKKEEYNKGEIDECIFNLLMMNQPEFVKSSFLVDKINENYKEYLEFRIGYSPKLSFRENKDKYYLKKIGCRAFSLANSATKELREEGYDYNTFTRAKILEDNKLNLSYDVKSSVPRVNRLMKTGEWVDNSVDFYTKFIENYISICPGETMTMDSFTALIRTWTKSLFMPSYFSMSEKLANNIIYNLRRLKLDSVSKSNIHVIMKYFKQAIHEYIGEGLDSEIFLHESNIYLRVTDKLFENGYFVWMCYDAFYARKDGVSQEEFEKYVSKLVEEEAEAYYKDFIELRSLVNDKLNILLEERKARIKEERRIARRKKWLAKKKLTIPIAAD